MSTRNWDSSLLTSIKKAQNDADYYNRYQALLISPPPTTRSIGGLIANPQSGSLSSNTVTSIHFGQMPQFFRNEGNTTVLQSQQFLPLELPVELPVPYLPFIYSFDHDGTENPLDHVPILNTGYIKVSKSYVKNNNTYTVTIHLVELNDNGEMKNGITFIDSLQFYNNNTTHLKILQFGSIPLSREAGQFSYLTDIHIDPITSPMILTNTNFTSCFENCSNFNSDISNWTTTNVVSIDKMFHNASSFNQPIGSWNVSNVRSMSETFRGASIFDQSLGSWNTQSVTDMKGLFREASKFNQDISTWNTSNVINMPETFLNAKKFNQPIGSWNVTNVLTIDSMFKNADKFNANLNNWNTQNIQLMDYAFENAIEFNNGQESTESTNPLTWNTTSVTAMFSMFSGASSFNQAITYTTGSIWNTSNVNGMDYMFDNATNFNNGQTPNVGTTAPLNWITSGLPSLPVTGFNTNSGLTVDNSKNIDGFFIGS